jgi:hypothetical protein
MKLDTIPILWTQHSGSAAFRCDRMSPHQLVFGNYSDIQLPLRDT